MIPRLCYVTDGSRSSGGRAQAQVIEQAFRGGLRMVVLREFEATGADWARLLDALEPLRAGGLRVLASRRLDVTRAWSLDGVHLAKDAVAVAKARAWLGADAWIGYSAHDAAEAHLVANAGASYVTLSPIYPTDSKPDVPARGCSWLAQAVKDLPIPAFALGGVDPQNTKDVLEAGAWGVAAASAIGAAPKPEAAAAEFAKMCAEEQR